jgi:hypothetical protein
VNTANGKIRFRGINKIRITLGDQKLMLKNVIYISYLRLNIPSAERLKKDNYINYNNLFPHRFYNGTSEKTLIETDDFSNIPIIVLD